MTDFDRRVLLGIAGMAGAAAVSHFAKAGSLNPPAGPVAPTMLPLDQVEPRIPVDATHTPAASGSDMFTISVPGSYFLTGNLTGGVANNIIHITAPGVTLDLRGFAISGTGSNNGILIDASADRCWVCNGSVSGCGNGVVDTGAAGSTFANLTVSGAVNLGIEGGYGALVDGCHVQGCGGYAAIYTQDGARVTRSSVVNNTSAYGIYVGPGSTVAHCTAQGNAYSGTNTTDAAVIRTNGGCNVIDCSLTANTAVAGIYALGSTIAQCSVTSQSGSTLSAGIVAAGIYAQGGCDVTGCTVCYGTATNSPAGFYAASGSNVKGCTSYGNLGHGFVCYSDCLVTACLATFGNADGFHIAGNQNTLDDNRASGNNGTGIFAAAGTSNVIVRNYCSGNATQYDVPAGGNFGPVGNASTATSPWANF